MTDDELREAANAIDQLHRQRHTFADLEAILRALVARETEACCAAVCRYCRDDVLLINESNTWHHRGGATTFGCQAAAIRARSK